MKRAPKRSERHDAIARTREDVLEVATMRLLILIIACLFPLAAVAAEPGNRVVVIRTAHDPVFVWDASQKIYALVGNAASDRDVNAALQIESSAVAKSKSALLRRSTGTLTIRVVYQANITPHGTDYQDSTLGTATTYALFEVPVRGGVQKFRVVGKLPGR